MKQQTSENLVIAIFFAILAVGIFIDIGPVCMTGWNPTVGVCK